MKNRVIILGAGISGLSLGWKLAGNNVQVDILEASKRVGGLSGTLREDGYSLDVGPHSFFSEDKEILDTILKLFNPNLKPKPRLVKFYYKGRYLDYPLTTRNILFQMGFISGMQAASSFLKSKITNRRYPSHENKDETVEDWAIANFGKYLYLTFFKPYTEQFWKVPCRELSSHSIPTHTRTSFANTCRWLLHRRIARDGTSLIEREALPTYYPDRGIGEIAERIAQAITKAAGNIHLGCEATEIKEFSEGRMEVIYKQDGLEKKMDSSYIVSTIPLHLLLKMLNHPQHSEISESTELLDYRALVVLGLVTEKQNILKCNYMYMLDRPYNRIAEMNKFSPLTSPHKDNMIMVEFTCLRESAVWNSTKEELFERCIGSLTKDRIISSRDVKKLLLIRAPYAYPVYRIDYAKHLNRLLDFIHKYERVTTLGRTGEFKYMDADRCIRRSFDLAGKLRNMIAVDE